VVKADAYGHGAIPVARALAAAGADGFCVAAYDEAAALRAAGIDQPLLVLYPIPPDLAVDALREGIAVSAGDAVLLDRLAASVERGAAARRPPGGGVARGEGRLDVHLELETGLGRGGFAAEDAVAVARRIESSWLRLAGVWTHLQAAEDPELTARQMRRFDAAVAALAAADLAVPPRHAAASGGLLLGSVAAYDAVRPGLSIYGLVPDELIASELRGPAVRLRPVLSLHARPVRVADLPAGTGISYGPTFTTTRPSRIATLPLGYGDGWRRGLSNRADALVRGVRAPIVGNVAMDAVMVDVTDVPGDPVAVDDEFVLLGRQGGLAIGADELARASGTNSWEVVTAMSRRLPRVYDAPAGPQEVRTLVSG
jgi:alanine racemase